MNPLIIIYESFHHCLFFLELLHMNPEIGTYESSNHCIWILKALHMDPYGAPFSYPNCQELRGREIRHTKERDSEGERAHARGRVCAAHHRETRCTHIIEPERLALSISFWAIWVCNIHVCVCVCVKERERERVHETEADYTMQPQTR